MKFNIFGKDERNKEGKGPHQESLELNNPLEEFYYLGSGTNIKQGVEIPEHAYVVFEENEAGIVVQKAIVLLNED